MTTVSKHSATVTVGTVTVRAVEVEVTLDEGWAPYAQAIVVLKTPDAELAGLLDPREGDRATITLHQDYGDSYTLSSLTQAWPEPMTLADITAAYTGATLATLSEQYRNELNPSAALTASTRPLDLGVVDWSTDHRTARTTLLLASDEALLQDYAPAGTAPIALGLTSVREVVNMALSNIEGVAMGLGGAILEPGLLDDTIEADASTWEPGIDAWSFLTPIVQKSGLRLWCDEARRWRLSESLPVTRGALSLSYLGTVTEARDTISRRSDRWCDAVVIRYEWTDGAGVRQVAYDSATAPGGGSKVLRLEHTDRPYPGPGAAAHVLRRMGARGRAIDLQAVSDYTATPGVAVLISLSDTPRQTGVVSAVTWRQPADEMTVKSRDLTDTPDGVWALVDPGLTWSELALDLTWADAGAAPIYI